ncbi:MAG: 23S rRNA (adenine(2503)-C(2))-methyltransferase RlmN, partial [Planctomycetota bacterium]
ISGFDRLAALPGARKFHPAIVRRWTFSRGARTIGEMTDLPLRFREELEKRYAVRGSRVVLRSDSEDGTSKLLLEFQDGQRIESVIIPEGDRTTLCVSTQVGCGIRCAFCASGMSGLERNLSAGEIIEQFLVARELLPETGGRLTNLVLMGGGEPLNNFEAVRQALETLNHPDGVGFGARRITLSTIGIPGKIDRLEELGRQINLAISLHAPNEKLRGRLIPGLDRVPLADVLAAATRYFRRTGREITFEYVLLKGVNDSVECAKELVALLRGVRCTVNLIPLNPVTETGFERPDDAAVDRMASLLEQGGIKTTVRRSRGRDIDAACGQLRRRYQEP